MYKEVFAERLKKARNRTELSQTEVAELLGVDRSTIANYETGKRLPDIEKLGAIAECYGVSTDWLLGLGKQNNSEALNHEKYLKELDKSIQQETKAEKKKLAN